jgi:Leucine-rich repeat (LRR) protein
MVFEDPAVEAAVRKELSGPIGPAEAATLAELSVDLPRTTIDLRCFPSLDTLHIVGEYDELIDVTGIASLSKLKELTVYYTILENAELLAALTELERLTLASVTSKDLSFIWKLTSLRQLTDFDPLDISEISNLPYLTDLAFSSASGDLSPLSQADSLKTLRVTGVTDLTPLAQVESLETLDVSHNQISDPTPLIALPNLKSVNFDGCLLSDLTPLTQLTHDLGSLNLQNNPFDCEAQQANLALIREKVTELSSDCPAEP